MALLTIHDVAQWLTVKPSTLYGWVAQGKMPALKILGVLRFRREDIEALLEACQIQQPNLSRRPIEPLRQGLTNVDVLIAEAKRAVYTASRGKPDQDRATRKGEPHGSV